MSDDKMLDAVLSLKQDVGKTLQGIEDLKGYVGAVSANTKTLDKKLDDHIQDDQAHGIKTAVKVFGGIGGLGGFVMVLIEAWKFLTHK